MRPGAAWLAMGFRPFFLGAAVFSVLAMALWAVLYGWGPRLLAAPVSPVVWHGHEMVFGYALGVIAGFLLTASRNWTGMRTLSGAALLALATVWALARVAYLVPGLPLALIAAFDLSFAVALIAATAIPLVKARLWAHSSVIVKLVALALCNALFYLGAMGYSSDGMRLGTNAGLYLVVALILMLGRRVVPFFVERGVGYAFQATNRKWLDITAMVLFVAFAVTDVFYRAPYAVAGLAALLCVAHAVRIAGWHTRGIWSKPLLWVLFVAYGFLILGFALKAAGPALGLSPFIALHAFTVGGIGLVTLGMMARIALGHTGRSVMQPPAALHGIFAALTASAVARVVLPLLAPAHYAVWVGLSQVLWIAAFLGFVAVYAPILIRARIDGKPG